MCDDSSSRTKTKRESLISLSSEEREREREKERDENEESVFLLNASLCVCVSSFRVLKVDPKVCRERFVLLLRSEEEMCVFFVCVQKESLFQVSTLYR